MEADVSLRPQEVIDSVLKEKKAGTFKFKGADSIETFAIYRSQYMKNNTVNQVTGQVEAFIRNSYTGGATEMYIPSFDSVHSGNKLYCYDVNSLYPYIMANNDLPSGAITYIEGNIIETHPHLLADKLGFYYCKVVAPTPSGGQYSLEHPIIQIHNDETTISPLGTFEATLYSQEIINAIKFGYKFEIINGYYFESKVNLFKEYISDLYSVRTQYPKGHSMNLSAKLLMNSLYGRFGLVDKFDKTLILTKQEFNKLSNNIRKVKNIHNVEELGPNHFMVTMKDYNFTDNTVQYVVFFIRNT
jgi:hypothetical protein